MRKLGFDNYDSLSAILFAAILVLPCLRAFIPNAPQWIYFLPILGLMFIALQRLVLQPYRGLSAPVMLFLVSATALFLWLATTSFWSISLNQYMLDLVLVGALVVIIVLAALLLKYRVLEIFFRLVCILAAFVGLFVVGEYILLGSFKSGHTQLSETYLTIANLLGIAATGSTIRFIIGRKFEKLWGLLSLVLLLELSLSLARGALLFTVLIVLAVAFIIPAYRMIASRNLNDWLYGALKIGTTVFLVGGTFIMAIQVERTRMRLLRILSGDELDSGGRGYLWDTALENIMDSPWLGYGLGSNGLLSAGHDGGYPHNLFLQVWLDGGVLAVILLAVTLLTPIGFTVRWLWRSGNRPGYFVLPLIGMYMFTLLEYSKSGNFYTSRSLFLLGSAVITLAADTNITTAAAISPVVTRKGMVDG